MRLSPAPTLGLLSVLAGASCGDDAASRVTVGDALGPADALGDIGLDAPVDRRADLAVDIGLPGVLWSTCDPIVQTCGTGEKCTFSCPRATYDCWPEPAAGGKHGEPCKTDGTVPCSRGTHCVSGMPGTTADTCLASCFADADCPTGKTCMPNTISCSATPYTAIAVTRGSIYLCAP